MKKHKIVHNSQSNVVLLGIVSFFNDLSSEMILPILPMFITSLGGAGLVIGLVGGLRDSIETVLNVFSGYCSDRVGHKKIFVVSGYCLSLIFRLLLAFSQTWQSALTLSSLERVGKGIRAAPRDSIIADSMIKEKGKGFGIHTAFDSAGAILGSAITLCLFWFLHFSFKAIILIASMVAVLLLGSLYFVQEPKSVRKEEIPFKINQEKLPKKVKKFILIACVFGLANFNYMFFILRAQQAFVGTLSIGIPIVLYIFFHIFYAAFAIPFGILSDIVGKKKVIILGYLLFGCVTVGFIFAQSFIFFLCLFILYGIIYAMIDGGQRAYVSDLSSDQYKATALGAYYTATGLIALPCNIIVGILWQYINPSVIFLYSSLLSFLSVMLFFFLF